VAITLKTGNGGKDGFQPTTNVGGGKKGLKKTQNSTSVANLFGTGLKNRLLVVVDHPSYSWVGRTSGSSGGGIRCVVQLKQEFTVRKSAKKKSKKKIVDDDIDVSVTATDTTTVPHTPSNTITPRVPSGP
jgi:hypothetical protein